MTDWQVNLEEGSRYLAIISRPSGASKFSASTRYNIAAMALEKYVMALCMARDYLPENHTLSDLLHAAGRFVPISETLLGTLVKQEEVQLLCSVDEYRRSEPSESETTDFCAAVAKLCNQFAEATRSLSPQTLNGALET